MELARRLWLLPPMAVTAAEASAEAEDVELIRFITNFTYKVRSEKERETPSPCVESILVDLSTSISLEPCYILHRSHATTKEQFFQFATQRFFVNANFKH